MSCASAGNCAVGGEYTHHHAQQVYVAAEKNGRWAKATGVPGLPGLNGGGYAGVLTVSCTSAGNCAAGGHTTDPDSQDFYGFVAAEKSGAWGKAKALPGGGEDGYVDGISCDSAGNCLAGGADAMYYTDTFKAFLVVEAGTDSLGRRQPRCPA